ncbi:porin [Paracoccus benzoatiresistens]|uniref:Porin n=1 Tax=Paracoccus benzoatiresistens TaxID=2997341 RepID=A0ABT4J7H4_9RHOB|nr:porin [Paracoccus sp. EF6]MCZ0963043.1 porin [Paracoccus sp. EF6]
MKKALIASTALVLTAGVAAADVTISGYGRTGVIYYESDDDSININESRVQSRVRMNIDASTSTDQGVDFGARVRLQWDQGGLDDDLLNRLRGVEGITLDEFLNSQNGTGAEPNAGKLYVTASGLTVEVGNVDTAMDSSGLIYATELGAYDRSVGFSGVVGAFFAYSARPYVLEQIDRLGIRAVYAIDNLTVQASYIDPDQSGRISDLVDEDGEVLFPNTEEEFGVAVDYTWNERLELSAAYTKDGLGIADNDIFFIGARYAVMENARIGLNYVDTPDEDENGGVGNTFALYGDYTLADGLTNIEAYIANNDRDSNETDTSFGVGVNYDLGGARLGASLQSDYQERITADMGVRFDF